MTEDQLRYFVTIADTGSYMETAMEFNISQSSISKQIQALESELGVQLFDRQRRRISLTDDGKQVLPLARHIIEEMSRLTTMVKKLQPGYKDRITLLTLPFVSYYSLYVPISRFEIENPSYMINLIELEEPTLFHKLQGKSYTVALTYWHDQIPTNKDLFIPVAVDEIVLAVHKDHPFAELSSITAEHLRHTPLMLMEPYTCIANLCMTFFEENDIVPNVIARGRPETIFAGVEAKHGVALISRKHVSYFSPKNVVLVPISPCIPAIFGAIINKHSENNPKVREFVNMLVLRNNE